MSSNLRIALIAGETSGDQLGGWLIEAIKKRAPETSFMGLGGANMLQQGLRSLFPMEEISLMGFTEVLPHYFAIKARIQRMVEYLEQEKPDIIITIDSMGFNHRVIKLLRERGKIRPRLIHYVAPTVWAYRPKRAEILAGLYDDLLCILPFEPPYFEAAGLTTHFIGHEIAWYWRARGDGAAFRAQHGIAANTPLVALFPGSRHGELNRMLKHFKGALIKLQKAVPGLETVIQVPEFLLPRLQQEVKNWPIKTHLLSNRAEKKNIFAAANVALAKSGTIGLECALAGLPSVISYRANPITAAILRRILKISYVNLANILSKEMIIPELLQEDCNADSLANALQLLLTNTQACEQQKAALRNVATMLGAADSISPSEKATNLILAPALS